MSKYKLIFNNLNWIYYDINIPVHTYIHIYVFFSVWIFMLKLCTYRAFIVMPTVALSFWLTMMGFQSCSAFPTEPVMGFFEILLLVALPWSQMELSIKKAIRRLYICEFPCKVCDRIIQLVGRASLSPVLMWL